jgi:SAM-dependent methyltransferase
MKRDQERIREEIKKRYGKIAASGDPCCGPTVPCCGTKPASTSLGYGKKDLERIPPGSDLGLGCGNPLALASLEEGEVVVDLGSGAGLDAFLAAERVGEKGRVIGVDMTPEMISRARRLAEEGGYTNVEFRLGEIENLPVPDGSADVVISNCVINLSTDKRRVFREAFRVLKPGGRIHLSDVVLYRELPPGMRDDMDLYASCIAGASLLDEYLEMMAKAGFVDIRVVEERPIPWDPSLPSACCSGGGVDPVTAGKLREWAASVTITARKPR